MKPNISILGLQANLKKACKIQKDYSDEYKKGYLTSIDREGIYLKENAFFRLFGRNFKSEYEEGLMEPYKYSVTYEDVEVFCTSNVDRNKCKDCKRESCYDFPARVWCPYYLGDVENDNI